MAIETTWEWTRLRRRQQLLSELRRVTTSNLMRGSLVTVQRRCGKPTCICVTEGRKHPGQYLTVKLRGRARCVYVRPEQRERVQEALLGYERFWKLLDELTEVNLELVRGGPRRRKRA